MAEHHDRPDQRDHREQNQIDQIAHSDQDQIDQVNIDQGRIDQIAQLDLSRARRRGIPEAIYGAGKTPEQLAIIAQRLRDASDSTERDATQPPIALFTKMDETRRQAVQRVLPDSLWDADAGLLAWPATPVAPRGGTVVVACAGTSDLPIAKEAELTARFLGCTTQLIVDIGVAGLHRVLGRLDDLEHASVIIVVAGMDGALPSVMAGLVSAPVIAVPTSVGYGASFGGISALLGMLNACAPGVSVVNIDNGYGAGHLAAQICHTNL